MAPCFSEGSIIFRRSGVFGPGGFAAFQLLCLIAGAAQAEELPTLEFSIKPRLCVLTAGEEACYDEVQVRWRSPRRLSLCLYQNRLEDPITCWQKVTEGQHRLVLSATDSVTFHLREPGKDWQITEAFEVIHDHQQYRRQRRNPWSFF